MIANRMKSVLLVGILVGVATLATGCPGGGDCATVFGIVFFADENLELAVRRELDLVFGPITSLDMQRLDRLEARNLFIRDLEGIQFATSLTWLDLSNDTRAVNTITDLDPLRCLLNLTFLNLENNDISDVTPLARLERLGDLFLAGNEVVNISPLVALAEVNDRSGEDVLDTITLEVGPLGTLVEGEFVPFAHVLEDVSTLLELGVDLLFVESSR